MYFPAARCIPFISNVDMCVLKYANESSFTQHGSRLVEVATEKLRHHLEVQFISLVKEIYLDYDQNRDTVHSVFLEFTRILCNTRIPEFLDVHRQVAANSVYLRTVSDTIKHKIYTFSTTDTGT